MNKIICKNGENCPWCDLYEEKIERCEWQVLREVQSLYRPNTYWIKKEIDKDGIEGYILKVFHGRISKMFSDSWATTNLENLKLAIEYLKEKKVDMGSDSLTI